MKIFSKIIETFISMYYYKSIQINCILTIIVFDPDHPGAFRKSITIYYKGKDSPDTLFIKGETKKTEE